MKGNVSLLVGALIFLLSVNILADGRTGCLYWSWQWPEAADYNITKVDMVITITNDPQTDVILFFSTQLNCGTPEQQTVCYYGLQTNLQGRGKELLFSRWDTLDPSNARSAGTPDSWVEVGSYEGKFVGVRRLFNWTTHTYILRLTSTEAEDDGIGRWFNFSIIDTETQEETYVGALRFPKDSSGIYPTLLTQGFGSFIEQPVPVPTQYDVPLWKVGIERPRANNQALWAISANWWFAPVSTSEPWQNNDIWVEGETIFGQIGGDTQRIHGDTGSLSYCKTISSLPSSLPIGFIGTPYSQTLVSTGGTEPYTYILTSGTLPPGISLIEEGEFIGTPTDEGSYQLSITVTDSRNCYGENAYTIQIANPPIISNITKLGNPFRLKVYGSNFHSDILVYIGTDTTPWGNVKYKDSGLIILKGGSALKAKFPKGVPVQIKVVNGDGGYATYTYTR